MAIKIETEKIVLSDGNLARKIIKADMINKSKLPKLYLDKTPRCYNTSYWGNDGFQIDTEENSLFYPNGKIVLETEWQEIVKQIHACGDRLRIVNEYLKRAEKAWNGAETFII
jgi:arginine decarboxylase-like protein